VLEHNLDGTTTEYFPVTTGEAELFALLRDVFETHWREVVFGPCIQGAVFEARFTAAPRLALLDGYLTIGGGPTQPWHLHLCIGPHAGTPARPTPPELARWRRCARAAFFRDRDRHGQESVWGFRMWNGRDEQMITIFFPNPWLESETMRPRRTPDWAVLTTWMALRAQHAGVAAETPPDDTTPPVLH
jgi:hypothetical protein